MKCISGVMVLLVIALSGCSKLNYSNYLRRSGDPALLPSYTPLQVGSKDEGETDGTKTEYHPQLYWVKMDASQRQSVIYCDTKGNAHVISEPPPDIAVSRALDLSAKIRYEEVDANLALQHSTEVVQLAKQSVAVGVLRAALYKLSEMCIADDTLDVNEYNLFVAILETAGRIAMAEESARKSDLVLALVKAYELQREIDPNTPLNIVGPVLNILNEDSNRIPYRVQHDPPKNTEAATIPKDGDISD